MILLSWTVDVLTDFEDVCQVIKREHEIKLYFINFNFEPEFCQIKWLLQTFPFDMN